MNRGKDIFADPAGTGNGSFSDEMENERPSSIMISAWPEYVPGCSFPDDEKKVRFIIDVIKAVRNIRLDMNVDQSRKTGIIFVTEANEVKELLSESGSYLERLASVSGITVKPDRSGIPSNAVSAVIPDAAIFILLDELIDIRQEIERLEKEKEMLVRELDRVNGMLSNEKFINRAPAKVVDDEKAKLARYSGMYEKVAERLGSLKKG